MAIILNIDTSGSKGLVAIAQDGNVIQSAWNHEPMQHASFVQPAIAKLLKDTGILISEVDAIAVSNGPGSYTGLRVGLASAKGLCFALNRPLIAVVSLQVLAYSAYLQVPGKSPVLEIIDAGARSDYKKSLPVVFCAMIDARRMEVFFALYNEQVKQMLAPRAAIVNEHFLQDYIDSYQVVAMGSGADKWRSIAASNKIEFALEPVQDRALCILSYEKYKMSEFDSLVDTEPFYTKEFHSTNPLHHQ
jgi:tRNA threonylcarbamoyladenosine biosynthesis protein TsaB